MRNLFFHRFIELILRSPHPLQLWITLVEFDSVQCPLVNVMGMETEFHDLDIYRYPEEQQPIIIQQQQSEDAMDVDYEEAMSPYEQKMADLLETDIATRAEEMVPETPEHSQT